MKINFIIWLLSSRKVIDQCLGHLFQIFFRHITEAEKSLLLIIESLNDLGWKGSLKTQSNSPARNRNASYQMRFHKALCNLILNASYLGNLFPCLISLVVKKCLLISNLNLASFNLEPLPLVLSLQNVAKSLSLSNLPDLLGDIVLSCTFACLPFFLHSFFPFF